MSNADHFIRYFFDGIAFLIMAPILYIIYVVVSGYFFPGKVTQKEQRQWNSQDEILFEFNRQRLLIFKNIKLSAQVKLEAIRLIDSNEALELSTYCKRTGELLKVVYQCEEMITLYKSIADENRWLQQRYQDNLMAVQWKNRGK